MAVDLTNLRFKEYMPGVYSEALAPRVSIFWDPATDGGSIIFDHYDFLLDQNGVPKVNLQNMATMSIPISEIIMQPVFDVQFFDPVSGAEISGLTGAGVAAALKSIFNRLYNQKYAPPPEPEPEPEPEPFVPIAP